MASEDHYFSADPNTPYLPEPVEVEIWGQRLMLTSAAGVFSRGRLDRGTAVLFAETEPPGPGRFLDLGCGWGVIGLAIAASQPEAIVDAVDVNERAVRLAGENAAAIGVADRFAAATTIPDGVSYDEIWSNPPIRIGKPALHALLLDALSRLRPGGRLVMVVGKNLGADSLAGWLDTQGWSTTRLGSAKGFRVLAVRAFD